LRITERDTVTIKPYKVVYTLAPDGWHVTFGTAKMGLRRLPTRVLAYKMPATIAQCTNNRHIGLMQTAEPFVTC